MVFNPQKNTMKSTLSENRLFLMGLAMIGIVLFHHGFTVIPGITAFFIVLVYGVWTYFYFCRVLVVYMLLTSILRMFSLEGDYCVCCQHALLSELLFSWLIYIFKQKNRYIHIN